MSQTKEGAIKARETNLAKYGADYYRNIGRAGGKVGTTGGFGQGEIGRERARTAGQKGGKNRKGWRKND